MAKKNKQKKHLERREVFFFPATIYNLIGTVINIVYVFTINNTTNLSKLLKGILCAQLE